MASAPPGLQRQPALGRRVARVAGAKVTARGYPVCHVSTASAPERLPPARSVLSAARVAPVERLRQGDQPFGAVGIARALLAGLGRRGR